jgi:hypothetical protein
MFHRRRRKDTQMDIDITLCSCSASTLAKSLLRVWLSQVGPRLREQLDDISSMPDLPEGEDESDRVDLLKGIASRMRDSSDLFALRPDDPGMNTWISLLHHLSAAEMPAGISE